MSDYEKPAKHDDWPAIHKEALEDFKLCQSVDKENRENALDDLRFARLGEQWPREVMDKRAVEGRPCMTFNRMPTFIRQVVNEGRQRKPAIKVHPADDKADPDTAEIINDLIRNIEYTSDAEVAYDTGLDYAASCSMGYWKVGIKYSHMDTFEKDIVIERCPNPMAILRDYDSTAADSSDWMRAFEIDSMNCESFEAKYKGKGEIDWDSDAYTNMPDEWRDGKDIIIASYWRRREVMKTICLMSDGTVVDRKWLDEPVPDMPEITNEMMLAQEQITVSQEREAASYKVTQYVLNGAEVLEQVEWVGCYIPIVPVYGEELNVEGRRHFRSLIRDAKDAQRNFNYWRSASTELVALAPKAPFIGKVGQFDTDADKWASANTQSHAYIEYDDMEAAGPPQRQPFAGVPAGALQEALNASDDMKTVIGIYDASLGARSNETSGVAINARKSEGDTGTFHFIDNQARAIRHTGRILIDLIPKVYNKPRIIRVLGQDKEARNVPINQQYPGIDRIYDLTAGKYDLTVDTGPSFQTRREEASAGMTELIRALPQAAPIIAPRLAKAQDWPDADDIAKELEMLNPAASGKNPDLMAAQQQIQQLSAAMGQQQQEMQQLQQQVKDKQGDLQIKAVQVQIDAYNAETQRLKIVADQKMHVEEQLAAQINQQAANTPDIAPGGEQATPAQDPAQAQPDQTAQAMAAIMEEMRQIRAMMSAPRRKTLVRGPDGRASHAIEEIEMPQPEEQPAPGAEE